MKFNDKIKNIKVSVENLIKDIQFDVKKKVALVVFAGSFLPVIGSCTQEELMHAGQIINNYTGSDVSVDIPDVVVEPPSVEPVVDVPVVEPEVVEPEEINPKDYAAVYDLDFEIPVYTEEEVEAARARLEENYERMDEATDDWDKLMSIYDECSQDYYIANQDILYYIYSCCKDVDLTTVCHVNQYTVGERFYYDENSGFNYLVTGDYTFVSGLINDQYVSVFVGKSSDEMILPIGELNDITGLVQIGPGSWAQIGSENQNKDSVERMEEYVLENLNNPPVPEYVITDEEFVSLGFKTIENNLELSLVK